MQLKIRPRKTDAEELIPRGKQLKSAITESVERLEKMFSSLREQFVDREAELEQIKYALLTREHVLLKGAPGTAKSQMSRAILASIKGGSTFAIQFSKWMSEDYLFGPLNIKKLREEGEIVHNTKGSIVDADFAFIDEFFDGSDPLLRSTLEILNERTFTRNATQLKCPLHTAILTSNYSREEESTEAVLDRILFKSIVQAIGDGDGRMKMYRRSLANGKSSKPEPVKLTEVQNLNEFIMGDEVEVSDTALGVYDQVVREFMRQSTRKVSDRTCVKMLGVLKASAVLHGRKSVVLEDILSLQNALCVANDTNDQQVFETVYHRTVVQGNKERAELAGCIKLRHRLEKVLKEKQHSDTDKDTVLKIRALQNFVRDDIAEEAKKVTSDGAKEELDKIGEAADTAIQELQAVLNA